MTQRIGIIGGLSTAAAARFYESLVRNYTDRQQVLDCTMVHADIKHVLSLVSAKKTSQLATYLVSLILQLQQAGAEIIALPAVTPHYCIDALTDLSPVPILSILDVIRRELLLRSCRRIVIFGTRFAIETALWNSAPPSVDTVPLMPEEVDAIHDLYVRLVGSGTGMLTDTLWIREMAHDIIRRLDVDTIVLAGTDFVVLPDRNFDFPHIDAFDAYSRATAEVGCRLPQAAQHG